MVSVFDWEGNGLVFGSDLNEKVGSRNEKVDEGGWRAS